MGQTAVRGRWRRWASILLAFVVAATGLAGSWAATRTWQLRVYPVATLLAGADRRRTAVTLGVGALVTLLLTALVGVLAGARAWAQAKVDRATAALREDIRCREETEARLRRREGELRQLAFRDPLTGLANWTLFHERVEHALATHSRSRATLAVLYLNLDGFKQVNEALGLRAGDAVLVEIAGRLRQCVRESDTVARLGGDEFAVLFEQIDAPDDATTVAERVLRAVQVPFHVDGHPCHITASVGASLRIPGDRTADAILYQADAALQTARAAGGDRYALADAGHRPGLVTTPDGTTGVE